MRALLRPWGLTFAVVVVFACATDQTVGPDTITALSVAPDTLEVGVGQIGQLSAIAFDEHGIGFVGVATEWTSQDPGIATVSETGAVGGVAVGTTTVTASAEGFTASAVKARFKVPDMGTVRAAGRLSCTRGC